MASQEHLERITNGFDAWHQWRADHPKVRPNLSGADLSELDLGGFDLSRVNASKAKLVKSHLSEADLSGANLSGADLSGADLDKANLSKASLSRADLRQAYMNGADFSEANLEESLLNEAYLSGALMNRANLDRADISEAHLVGTHLASASLRSATLALTDVSEADLKQANLSGADLGGAHLSGAHLMAADLTGAFLTDANFTDADLSQAILKDSRIERTIFKRANLTGAYIQGMFSWKPQFSGAIQADLVISEPGETMITVDGFDMAQFISLLLNSPSITSAIENMTTRVVLILGRFLPQKKNILNALRDELRLRHYVPVTLLGEKVGSRDMTATLTMLTRMARFVIADISETPALLQELEKRVFPLGVPLQLMMQNKTKNAVKVERSSEQAWVLEPFRYASIDHAMASLKEQVVVPVEKKAKER